MEDERLLNIQKERENALKESNNVYNNLLNDNQDLYNNSNENINRQEQIQNDVLDRQLNYQRQEIDKQKQEAQKNYDTESKRALNGYTAFNNPYGYEAESMASKGLLNSGVSETTKLGSWNTYQNRLTAANKVMQDAFTAFDSDLNAAILNNDVQKAENALNKLKMQQDLLNSFYTNKSNYEQTRLSNNQSISNEYNNRYNTVYNQIQNEKEQQEAIRQFNEQLAFQKDQAKQDQSNWERQYALSKQNSGSKSSASSSTSNSNILTDYSSMINGVDKFGNSVDTQNKPDYYFEGGVQPTYVNNTKLQATGKKMRDLYYDTIGQAFGGRRIYTANGRYFAWSPQAGDYIDITGEYTQKFIDKAKANYWWDNR